MDHLLEFEWDWANLRHINHDNASRGIEAIEIESVFKDPFGQIREMNFDEFRNEQRFKIFGESFQKRKLIVIFVLTKDNLIRSITAYVCKSKKLLIEYESAKNQ
jgi:uncharacterized DUF497 family protein